MNTRWMHQSVQTRQFLSLLVATKTHVRSISTTISAAPRDDLLRGVAADHRDDVARVLEMAERAVNNWTVEHSQFLPPPVVADAMLVLQKLADVVAVPWGGYPGAAERCRISVGREESMAEGLENPILLNSVAAVKVQGNFLFDPATHRDFLGACLGTGIERHVIGDILVQGDNGAQMLVVPGMVEHLESALIQVRTVPVTTRAIALNELRVPTPKVMEISSVEASLRLDAIASAGFRVSRSKISDMIKGGDVRVNWKTGKKTSVEVAAGDVISCSGKGRVEVKSVTRTQKGKFAVAMVRYV